MAKISPKAFDTYWKHGFNVLLESLHGVGKTALVADLAERMGIKVAYFSCSTLDPFTDLVGIPVPSEDRENLVMVRPRAIDEAELIFFDELNRAETKVTNAVLEIINQRSINGEALPNLRCCWAAVNPVEGYDTAELDPALRDRFDIFETLDPEPSVDYMVSEGISEPVAEACVRWYNDHDGAGHNYLSPRRLSKIAMAFEATKSPRIVEKCIPNGIDNADTRKLGRWLNDAANGKSLDNGTNVDGAADPSLVYTKTWITENPHVVTDVLSQDDSNLATHNAVVQVINGGAGNGLGTGRMVEEIPDVLFALQPAAFDAMFNGWSHSKRSNFRSDLERIVADKRGGELPAEAANVAKTVWTQGLPPGITLAQA